MQKLLSKNYVAGTNNDSRGNKKPNFQTLRIMLHSDHAYQKSMIYL